MVATVRGAARNAPPISKTSLTPSWVALVQLMQDVNFGRIEGLAVRSGEPVLDPRPRIVREVKFGGENGPRPEIDSSDFALKSQVLDLFRCLDELRDGTVETLVIKHGLPFSMSVEAAA